MARSQRDRTSLPPRAADPPAPNRRLRRFLAQELAQLAPAIAQTAARCGADRYRKHFTAFQHACLLLFHGLRGGASLRQSYAAFAACPGLVALADLARDEERLAVGFSQVAASNTTRPAAFLADLLPALVARVRRSGRARIPLPPDLLVLDSTFRRVSLVHAPWLPAAPQPRHQGVRIQCLYAPARDLPAHTLVTTTRCPAVAGLDALLLDDPDRLAALAGQTLVLDLGYYSHARFARLRAAGVHVVCRRQAQATVVVTADRPEQARLPGLPPGRITVQADQAITLGSPNNRRGTVLADMRLVTAVVAPQGRAAARGDAAVTYELITDRWDLPPEVVVQLYLWRWQIELFFRWLKHQVHLPRLLGYSPNAIALSVALAILVHVLLLLAAAATGRPGRSPTLLAQLPWVLAQLGPADLADQAHTARQAPLPGWAARWPAPT